MAPEPAAMPSLAGGEELDRGETVGDSDSMVRMQPTQSFAGISTSIGSDSLSIDDLKRSDVLLSYAPIDDHPLQDGKPGWVSQLYRNLEVRMEQLSGSKVNIARLP